MKRRQKPIIMTATMGAGDFSWANGLRQRHYPPERNHVSAHITLFHHLSPQGLDEIAGMVKETARIHPSPPSQLVDVMHLGGGVAYRLYSPELLEIRQFFAESFHGLLTLQDQQKPRFHITIQNKATDEESNALIQKLSAEFVPRPFEIVGLGLSYYLDGPWEEIGSWRFRGKV